MKFSPIVGIFGHRQVGKSTFIAGSVNEYQTLDDVNQLEAAGADPKNFVRNNGKFPLAIDECQLEPKLFSTLKEWVRVNKRPGQFVLSGSVRFTSRKAIRESLAGRMASIEMFPFSVAEILGEPLPDIIPQLVKQNIFSDESLRYLGSSKKSAKIKKNFEIYLEHGGLPGLCFIRSQELRKNALNDLHNLILGRDLRLIGDIKTPLTTIKKLMSYIANNTFEPYNAAEVRRVLGLAPQTQKNLLFAMESIFLIRRVPIPIRKKEIILLEDQFEELIYGQSLRQNRKKRIESAVYRNIRTQFGYRLDKNAYYESYLTPDYARVPIVIKSDECTLGIIVTEGEMPSLSESRSATSFLRKHASAKLLYLSTELISPKVLDERSMLCSIYMAI